MKKLCVKSKEWDFRPGSQLLIIKEFTKNFNGGENEIDFTDFLFCPPLLSVYFSKFINNFSEIKFSGVNSLGYLSAIRFPEGFDPERDVENWKKYLDGFTSKSYLPIIKFGTGSSRENITIRNNLISHIGSMIRKITGINTNYYAGISYLLSELTDNIVDHSRFDHGWMSFQYYPSEGFMDICLGDTGIGILGSYQQYSGEKDFSGIRNNLDAVEAMIQGDSTKSVKERGFGVHTSREMLVKGLNGTFVFISGNALLHNYKLVDFGCESTGTLAFIRIPCVNQNERFNVYDYVE